MQNNPGSLVYQPVCHRALCYTFNSRYPFKKNSTPFSSAFQLPGSLTEILWAVFLLPGRPCPVSHLIHLFLLFFYRTPFIYILFSSPLSALSDPLPAAWVNPSPTRRPGTLESHESRGGRFGGCYSSSSVLPLWLIISKRKLITSTNISKAVEMMRGRPDGATARIGF